MCCYSAIATATPSYRIEQLGFQDVEHTSNDGSREGGINESDDTGRVLGYSVRYNGGGTPLGASSWIFQNGTTLKIGLTDSEQTRADGYRDSGYVGFNESWQIIGTASRFNGGSAFLGLSGWLYDGSSNRVLGLTGSEHTRNDGFQRNEPQKINEAGQAIGRSDRYNGGNDDLGDSAWFFDGTNTINVGLTGSEHTRSDGFKSGEARYLNELGQVAGVSGRFSGNSQTGVSAWLYEGTETIDLSLTESEYIRNDGHRHSNVIALNEAGQVLGFSARYNGGSVYLGQETWLYEGGSRTSLGLGGTEHTRGDGYISNDSYSVSDNGDVFGYAERFNSGNSNLGRSEWHYDGTSTTNIGLTGNEHTRSDGYKFSESDGATNGWRLGYSERFNGGSMSLGQTTWLYDGTTTREIGLTGAEHTRNDGYKYSIYNQGRYQVTSDGQTFGYSNRFNGGSVDLGRSAWIYDGNSTIAIGLTDAEHTRSDGYRFSMTGSSLNEAGQTAGFSRRYSGATELGQSAWFYDGAVTTRIGLTDSEYTRTDGYQYSEVNTNLSPNEAGQMVGFSRRYVGSASRGQDAWLYDPSLNQTFAFGLSVASNDYAYSIIDYFQDGIVLGRYEVFDVENEFGFPEYRTFYFSIEHGLHDLGSLVDGGLDANGWQRLAKSIDITATGQILGHGFLGESGGIVPYLLTPITADFDNDGDIDGRDFLAWQRGFGKTDATLADGDANGDSLVNDEDLAIWQEQYADVNALAANVVVPEPNAIMLAAILLATGLQYRRPAIRRIAARGMLNVKCKIADVGNF